jgi:glycosyltransferase involved in cell wall biosynthesis
MIKVSVVIPVYNDNRIGRCLESLAKQSLDKRFFEIIVIENGTKGRYQEICEKYGARYFNIQQKSMPLARNVGLSESQGEIVMFTDADCVANPDWIENMINAFKNKNYVGFGGEIERYFPKTKTEIYGKNVGLGQTELLYLQILDKPYVVFANAAFRKYEILKVGGFDEELLSGSDVDLCWKLGLANYKIGICKNAIVFHENRKNAIEYFKIYFRYAVYQSLLFKNYRRVTKSEFMINTYAIDLLFKASIRFLKELFNLIKREKVNFYRPFLDLVESIAIIIGHLYGSFKFKTYYV